jgi:hypothetical protein
MESSPLSSRQRSILYALVHQMVHAQEISLANAIAAERTARDDTLDKVCQITLGIFDLMDRLRVTLGVVKPASVAARKLLDGDVLRSVFYLAEKFDVERSDLYFPGVSLADNRHADDEGKELASPPGDLDMEFPSMSSRKALFASLAHWTRLDSQYTARPDGTVAKLAHALPILDSAQTMPGVLIL